MKLIATFTIAGRVPGKIRWAHGKHKPTAAEKRYRAARDQVRALALKSCERVRLPIAAPYRLGVAMFLAPVRTGPNAGELPRGGGVGDYDNVRGAILDALQTCEWCKRINCKCPKPLRVLVDDSPYHYRGSADCVEHGAPFRDGVFLADADRVVVTLWSVAP